jgi:uncharacterized protein (DUF427 family)
MAEPQEKNAQAPARTVRIPGPDHPIATQYARGRVVVELDGRTLADSSDAIVLREANYAPVYYVARRDVDMSLLEATDHRTYCPYKGECSYFSIPLGGQRSVNAVWTYEKPYDAVETIAGRLAFYPDRVDSITFQPAE